MVFGIVAISACSKESSQSPSGEEEQQKECTLTISTKSTDDATYSELTSGVLRLGLYESDENGNLSSSTSPVLYSDDIPVIYGSYSSGWKFKYDMYAVSYDITDISFFEAANSDSNPPMILGIQPENTSSYSTGTMTSLCCKFNSYSFSFTNNSTVLRYVCQQAEASGDNGAYSADIIFKPLFAGIKMYIQSVNNSNMSISKIELANANTNTSGTLIKTYGYINVTTGEVIDVPSTSTTYNSASSLSIYTATKDTSGELDMLDIPNSYGDDPLLTRYFAPISGTVSDEFVLKIYLNDDISPIEGYVSLNDENGDKITTFEAGNMYTIHITIDDYLKFSGVTITDEFEENSDYGVTL